ncbi:hypothetical protein I8748_04520 [Nostoc sp. CENA67]|uniref:Heme oxygenase n=1 Tax=Amazonocrinis nigriterrae CENA67 TaxID=2794033 RepID=A0A8J7HSB5_9NOST|nr:hypothetical protein [Amazonocrinis nigriterrae]MBH8561449.1 hypothetical protein [Amazonocrinis nigriterrae CENA67]
MMIAQEYLIAKQKTLINNQLSQKLNSGKYKLNEFAVIAHNISFWVMSFQDLLRINLSQVTDKEYYQLVRQHLMEDVGHEKWFLDDLELMNLEQPNLQVLYSKPHADVRDATFSLMSEVFRATYDYERIIIILTLESAGHVFFESVANFVDKHNYNHKFKYFSNHHLGIEKKHELFEDKIQLYLNNIQLNHEEMNNISNMIDRMYKAFELMFDGLAIAMS